MDSDNPPFTYGRYYYGEEAVSGNDGNNIQYYRRETYGRGHHPPSAPTESRQILGPQGAITNNGYPDIPRSDSGTYTRNVFSHGGPMMSEPPSMHSLPQRYHEGNGPGLPAFSSESYAQNVYGRRSPMTMHSFQSRPHEVAGYNGYNSAGSYAHTVYRNGSPMMNASTNSYYFDRHGGYNDIPGAHHGSPMINAPSPMHSFQPYPNGGNAASYYDYNGVPAHDQNRYNSHFRAPSFHPLSNVHTQDDSIRSYENIDQSLNNERLKLVTRIKKCFKETAKDTFEKSSSLFDGQDWLKVSNTFSDGMKIYVAEMICPICHGKVSPQNKEKEAGRLPKWDLYSVKRHVITVHCKKEFPDENTAPSKLPTKENLNLTEQEEEKIEMSESSDGKSAEKNNSPSVSVNIQIPPEKSLSEDSSSDFPSSVIGDESDSADSEADAKNVTKKTSEKAAKKRILEKPINQRKSESTSESESDIGGKIAIKKKKTFGKRRRTEKTVHSPGNGCSDNQKGEKTAKKHKMKPDQLQQMNEPSSSESESNSTGISQWQKPGVTFGWVKMTVKSRFQPAFIFPKPKGEEKPRAQYIQLNGDLSDLTHPVEQVATPAEVESVKKSRKSQNYLIAIKKFNGKNNCNYTPNGPQL